MTSLEVIKRSESPIPFLTDEERAEVARKLYTPILEWETRVLYLHPGTTDEPLSAYLHVAELTPFDGFGMRDLSRRISYEALSYTWGDSAFTRPICVNNHDFSITGSLSEALMHLWKSDTGRYLWVDAICIDQSNVEEKSIQVANMFSIYSKASCVVIWLG